MIRPLAGLEGGGMIGMLQALGIALAVIDGIAVAACLWLEDGRHGSALAALKQRCGHERR